MCEFTVFESAHIFIRGHDKPSPVKTITRAIHPSVLYNQSWGYWGQKRCALCLSCLPSPIFPFSFCPRYLILLLLLPLYDLFLLLSFLCFLPHFLFPLPSFAHYCLSFFFLSFLVSLLVVGGAALPLAGVVHARCADGAGDEVVGAGGHEVSHCRRDVHPLVCHQVICREKTKTLIIQPNCF